MTWARPPLGLRNIKEIYRRRSLARSMQHNDLSAVAAAAGKATHMWTRPSFGRMSQCNKWGRVRINHGQPQNIRKLPWQEGVNNSMVALEVRIQSIVLSPLDRVLDLADFSLLAVGRWL